MTCSSIESLTIKLCIYKSLSVSDSHASEILHMILYLNGKVNDSDVIKFVLYICDLNRRPLSIVDRRN